PVLAALRSIEQACVCYDRAAPSRESAVAVLRGTLPILISAPHSSRHWRSGDWKQEEEYTAALGYLLHRVTGAHLIYGRYLLNPDPHDDQDDCLYKCQIDELFSAAPISLVLDLHGARGDRDFAVALGTIRGESFTAYESDLLNTFQHYGFTLNPDSSLDR